MKGLTPARLTIIMFGAMVVLVALYVAKNLWAKVEPPPPIATRNIPSPVADIPAGTEITERHLGLVPVKVTDLQADMLAVNRVIVGRVAKEPLKKATPIRANQLYEPGQRPPLPLAKGMQALTIDVPSSSAIVDGLFKPGDLLDIHLTLRTNTGVPELKDISQITLMKGMKVLAINRSVVQRPVDESSNAVTFEVTPRQANVLLLCQEYGRYWCSLSGEKTPNPAAAKELPAAKDSTVIFKMNIYEALGIERQKAVAQTPPTQVPHWMAQQYRYTRRSEIRFFPNREILDGRNNGTFIQGLQRQDMAPNGGQPAVNNGADPSGGNDPFAPANPAPAPGSSSLQLDVPNASGSPSASALPRNDNRPAQRVTLHPDWIVQ